jgi:hypothetical protein
MEAVSTINAKKEPRRFGLVDGIVLLSVVLYLLSLAFQLTPGIWGWEVLIAGWFALATPPTGFFWFANIMIFVTWGILISRNRPSAALQISILGLAIAVSFRFMVNAPIPYGYIPTPALGLGYYFWTASFLSTLIAAALSTINSQQNAPHSPVIVNK